MSLPSASEFTAISVTKQGFRDAMTRLRDHIAALLGTSGDASEARRLLGLADVPEIATVRGAWATATAYAAGEYVTNSGVVYRSIVAHTSGTFSADLAAGKWIVAQGLTVADAASTASGKGASLVALFGGGTLQDAISAVAIKPSGGDDRAALAAADAAAAARGVTLILAEGNFTLGSSITFSAAVEVRRGAVINILSGVVCRFDGGFTAHRRKCLNFASSTDYPLFIGISEVCAEWFGAKADSLLSAAGAPTAGSGTDNTEYINQAILAAVKNRARLTFGASDKYAFRVTGKLSVLLEAVSSAPSIVDRGVWISGSGKGTVIFNDSVNDTFVLEATAGANDQNTQNIIEHFTFKSLTGTRPLSFVRNKTGINTKVRGNNFQSCYASEGFVINEIAYGMAFNDNTVRGVAGAPVVWLKGQLNEALGYSYVVDLTGNDISFAEIGVLANGGTQFDLSRTTIQKCTTAALRVDPTALGNVVFHATMINGWFEQNAIDIDLPSNVSSWTEMTIIKTHIGLDSGGGQGLINLGSKSKVFIHGRSNGGSVEITGSGSAAAKIIDGDAGYTQTGSFNWATWGLGGDLITTRHLSAEGSVSVPTAVATTLTTLAAVASGTWLVTATLETSSPTNWGCVSILQCSNSTWKINNTVTSAFQTLSMSGNNLQTTQTSGATQTIKYVLTRLA